MADMPSLIIQFLIGIIIGVISNIVVYVLVKISYEKNADKKSIVLYETKNRYGYVLKFLTISVLLTLVGVFIYNRDIFLQPQLQTFYIIVALIFLILNFLYIIYHFYYKKFYEKFICNLSAFFRWRYRILSNKLPSKTLIAILLHLHTCRRDNISPLSVILNFFVSLIVAVTSIFLVVSLWVLKLSILPDTNPLSIGYYILILLISVGLIITIIWIALIIVYLFMCLFSPYPVYVREAHDCYSCKYSGFLINDKYILNPVTMEISLKTDDFKIEKISTINELFEKINSYDYINSLKEWIDIEKEFYKERCKPYYSKGWKNYFINNVWKFLIYWLYPLKTDRAIRSKIDIDKLEKVIRKDIIDKTLKKELKMKDREIKKVKRDVNKSFKKIHKLKLKEGVKDA